ncbi:Uncharacterised protein [Moraxella ovis]|uniref:Lipoprotein n=1 Tax=Moraxella ovis TaxID=29433 RepID=A0A378PJ09_9GAMM|nr:hypothetical protein [Moraxella ovis]SPX84946.1 Uncharacterised protein [Moraxella ovis]STY86741.1 Uncharacterised protein [Moraxella ovis]STZ05355.1 Uncharacterised protein [Moraxella ovis]
MRIIILMLPLVLTACMNMTDFSESKRQTPQTYPTYDPNCQRHIPVPRTPQGYPDMSSPEYQETHQRFLIRTHCP